VATAHHPRFVPHADEQAEHRRHALLLSAKPRFQRTQSALNTAEACFQRSKTVFERAKPQVHVAQFSGQGEHPRPE
jgi:hypothetical protein